MPVFAVSTRLVLTLGLLLGSAEVAIAASPGVSSNAHRPDARGAYGGLKSNRPPLRGAGDARDIGKKQPYYYRYYSDSDRSPGSCRRYAQRAIATRNSNWWTRYRACLK